MTEVAEVPDPLVIRAFISDEFTQSARRVVRALQIDDTWIARIRNPFVLLIDEEAIWLCPDDIDLEPYVSIGWPIVGNLRDSWGPRGGKAEVVAGVVFTVLTLGELGAAVGGYGSVLCVPVRSSAETVELKIPIESKDGSAREAEKRRPRTKRGPMLQWVPD